MLHEIESTKTIDQVCQDLGKAVVEHKFGVMTVHNLKETMKKRGLSLIGNVGSLKCVTLIRQKESSKRT
jgi:hypothetical protein